MDKLPDDIIYRIYQYKHQLEMTQSLRTIERFQYRTFGEANVYFNCVSPIKELLRLQIVTNKIFICLKNNEYDHNEECYFRMSPDYMKTMARKLGITIKAEYELETHIYPMAITIKYKQSRLHNPVSVIEMIELLALLKISFVSFRDRKIVLRDIFTTRLNRQLTFINLSFDIVG